MGLIEKAVGQICSNYCSRLVNDETPPTHTQVIVDYVHMPPTQIDALLAEFERRGPMEVKDVDVYIGDFFHEEPYHHVDVMVHHLKQFLASRLLDPLVAEKLEEQALLSLADHQ